MKKKTKEPACASLDRLVVLVLFYFLFPPLAGSRPNANYTDRCASGGNGGAY